MARVTLAIPLDLRHPVMRVSYAWPLRVLWTAMPEATVAEHCDMPAREDNIGADRTHARQTDWEIDSESQTSGV